MENNATENKENKEDKKYKKICRYGLQCKFKTTCNRAHTKDEYEPINCMFRNGCYNLDCKYYHPSRETIEEYIEKCRIFKQKIKKFTKFCNKMTEKTPCKIKGCPFAHSVDEFVLTPEITQMYSKKIDYVQKVLGSKIQSFMFRPSHVNHVESDENEGNYDEKKDEKYEDEENYEKDEEDEKYEDEENDENDEKDEEEFFIFFINKLKYKQKVKKF